MDNLYKSGLEYKYLNKADPTAANKAGGYTF